PRPAPQRSSTRPPPTRTPGVGCPICRPRATAWESRTRTAASTSSQVARPRVCRSAPRTSFCRCAEWGEPARHQASPVHLVEDVDGVVLAVGPGEAEEDREPAEESQPALLGERAAEDQLAAAQLEVPPSLLANALHVDLERGR